MPYQEDPRAEYVTFTKACTHGDLVAESGFVGTAVKQLTPAADAVRTSRNQIAIGEAGLLLVDQVSEVPAASLGGATKGQLVYIATADNSLSLTSGSGKVVAGRVHSLPGERGCPSTSVRVNLRQKV